MKKIIILALGMISLNLFASCDKFITYHELPQKAQAFIAEHFNGIDVLSVKYDDGEYEVVLANGNEIDFDRAGEWKDVDCHTMPVPAGIVPQAIATYVHEKFPDNFIVQIEKDMNRYKVDLNNDLDLVFDKNGNFLHVD